MEKEFRFSILTILILSQAAMFAAAQENTKAKGWVDKGKCMTLNRYTEQIQNTLFAKPKEITHWSYGSLVESVMDPDGKTKVTGLVAEMLKGKNTPAP